jgi:DNA helicase-2/ATP-dependent DNA helicase PcrA
MSLNERQQEAVDHEDGPLLVLAGAGSGKTRVLVHRIARLIEQGRARPHEILAVTFTNKAARELVDRCTARVGAAAAEVWAGTFHGIGARLMRRHAAELGYPAEFSIFDADDQMRLIKQLLEDAGIDPTVVPPEAVRAFIERHKNEARLPDDVAAATDDAFGSRALDLYAAYQKRLRTLGGVDFGDLILGVIVLLRSRPELLERYRQRFRHVLVDEYQDTNHAQYLMISMLAEGHRNICVVGDDDQSIYAWRGANVRNILEFERDFSGAHVVRLDQNYRSTRNIIEAAHAVISNNRERMDKRMWTDSADGPPITIFTATDERDEARYVVEKLIGLGEARSDAAVFYRTNAQSRALEEALVQARIPYTIVGTTRFYERREIKDLVAYLRFVHNPDDDVSLARVINVPARGIGRVTWERLRAAAAERGVSVWSCVRAGLAAPLLGTAARGKIERFAATATDWLAERYTPQMSLLLAAIVDDTDYLTYLEKLPGEDGRGRVENVGELMNVTRNFDNSFNPHPTDPDDPAIGPLAAFLEQLTLAAAVDSYEGGGAVTLMTVHNSKGLEFAHVFLIGMEEGIFPHARSTADEDGAGIEEERRLCYVGMTRARVELTLVHAVKRQLFGNLQFNFASRFLDEIPGEHTAIAASPQMSGEELRVRYAETSQLSSGGADPHDSQLPEAGIDPDRTVLQLAARSESGAVYRVGMKVVHPMFGPGTVRRCDGSGDGEKLVVQFQRAGIKKLMARYARLEIV